jgi:hypothetical protein
MPSLSISKLSQFWINLKINKTMWAPVDSLTDRTARGQRRPPQTATVADLPRPWFPATVSPPRNHHRAALCPLPLPPIKGAQLPMNSLSSSRPSPPLRRFVLPPSSHRVAPSAGSRGAIPFPCFPFGLVAQLKVGHVRPRGTLVLFLFSLELFKSVQFSS